VSIPRQCVFLGTTNETCFLRDRTGNRRWWPVNVGMIDLESLRTDIEQLWAEAVRLYQSGQPWHLTGEALKLAEDAQAERVVHTEVDVLVAEYLSQLRSDRVTTRDVMQDALHLDPLSSSYAEQAQRLGSQVANAITAAGWQYLKRKGKGRDRIYVRQGRPG